MRTAVARTAQDDRSRVVTRCMSRTPSPRAQNHSAGAGVPTGRDRGRRLALGEPRVDPEQALRGDFLGP
jgi:hypothetical protein